MPAATAKSNNKNAFTTKPVIRERLLNSIFISFSNSQDIKKLITSTIPDS